MKVRLLLVLWGVLLGVSRVWAQGSFYEWRHTMHSFGDIKETGGDVTHRFVLKNTGAAPLHILRANASCGCTSPSYSKEAIAPGDTGYVDVAYHPAGRPGLFQKTVAVETDGQPAKADLTISGKVEPRALTQEETYPDTLGRGLRTATRYLNLGQVSPFKGKAEGSFEVMNMGKAPVGLKAANRPKWVKLKLEPAQIAPGQKGKVTVSYDGKARKEFGYVSDPLVLETTGPQPGVKTTVYLTALLQEPVPALTEAELAKSEKLDVAQPLLDYGRRTSGTIFTGKTKVTNTGKAPLKLYAAKPGCKCLRTEIIKQTLAPGESTEVYVHFDGTGYLGRTEKVVTLYTSDPTQPAFALTVSADWENPPGKKVNAIE